MLNATAISMLIAASSSMETNPLPPTRRRRSPSGLCRHRIGAVYFTFALVLTPLDRSVGAADPAPSLEEVAVQVRQLAQAYAKYDQPRKEALRRQLVEGGDAVLAAILLQKDTLLSGTNREAAESVIATLPGPQAAQTAIHLLLAKTNPRPIEEALGAIFSRAHQEGLAGGAPAGGLEPHSGADPPVG
jgi:hypothetical protein